MALVTETDKKWELVSNAPTGVSLISAYRPYTGLVPARMAEAMASGILAMPDVKPAIRSAAQ